MGNSLQEQLLKAGLVDQKKAREVKKARHKQRKQRQGQPADEARQAAQKALAEQAEKNRELNRRRQEQAERKAVAAQIRQLIENNRVPSGDGDIPYHFVDGSKVRHLYVSKSVHDQLARGSLDIVRQGQRYAVVPESVAVKIRERDPSRVIVRKEPESAPAGDDPYAAFQVPDDLMW